MRGLSFDPVKEIPEKSGQVQCTGKQPGPELQIDCSDGFESGLEWDQQTFKPRKKKTRNHIFGGKWPNL